MKLRQTGSKIKITSTCRISAAERAMTGVQASHISSLCIHFRKEEKRTKRYSESFASSGKVVLQLVVQCTKYSDKEMQENPNEEEDPPPSLVDHPEIPFLPESLGNVRRYFSACIGVGPLKALKPPALGLVALKVARLARIDCDVGMLFQGGHPTV